MKDIFLNLYETTVGKIIGWIGLMTIFILPFLFYKKYLYSAISTKALTFMIIADIVFIILGSYLIFSKKKQNTLAISISPVLVSAIVLISIYTISALVGADTQTTIWSKLTRYTGLFFFVHVALFSGIMALLVESRDWFTKMITTIFFSGLVFSILSNFGTDGLDVLWFNKMNQADGFMIGNSTFAGTFLLMSFFVGLWWAWGIDGVKRAWWQKILPFIILINPMFLNYKTGIGEARSASVAVFVGAFLWIGYLVYDRIRNKKIRSAIKWISFISGILLTLGIALSFINPHGLVRKTYEEFSGAARPLVWEISANAIAERPWLGWGGDNFDIAFIKHFDSRLFYPEFGQEVWFDRAHNIFIDTLVDGGILGLLAYIAVYISAGYMLWKLGHVDDKQKQHFAVAGGLLLVLHLVEIQTAFDTVISYIVLGLIMALIHGYYVQAGFKHVVRIHKFLWIGLGILIIGFGIYGSTKVIHIMHINNVNGLLRSAGSTEKRLVLYPKLFSSPMDTGALLWRTVTDLQRGILNKPSVLEDQNQVAGFVKEFDYLGSEYKKYLENHPNDFRAILNTADVYLFMRLLQEDRLSEVFEYTERANQLVPQHPMPMIMKTVVAVYQNKFKDAYRYLEQAKLIDPTNPYTLKTEEWLRKQEKTFPELDFRFMEFL